ncbi:unnamed protein product [Rhizophagus irregularis]|nr:unnamed protein product [Rhizophagus irregularis]
MACLVRRRYSPGLYWLAWMKKISSGHEDLKKLNDLWKTPNKLKNINKHDDKSIENYERALAFEECKLELKERAAKKSSLIRTT